MTVETVQKMSHDIINSKNNGPNETKLRFTTIMAKI